MLLSNFKMEQLINSLKPFLDRTDIIGYAAARNSRRLSDQTVEYFMKRDELIMKYGKRELDGNHKETGRSVLNQTDPNFSRFVDEITPIGEIEHEVDIYKVPFEKAIDNLSGTELLSIDWMFEEE